MVYIRSRKFCCCLPVRFGVFCMSILYTAVGGFIAVVGWLGVKRLGDNGPVDTTDKATLYFVAIVYSLLAVSSIFALIGAIAKIRPAMVTFYIALTGIFLLSLASGAFTLYGLFGRGSGILVNNCVANSADDTDSTVTLSEQDCRDGINTIKWVALAVFIIFWLLMLYGIVIVYNYAEQLVDELLR